MPSVTVRDGALWVDQQRVPLLAGEIHYWRLSPDRWRDVLRQTRELGINVVSTYVPWQYHELSPGEYDFDGRTEAQRDLLGFLELLTRESFWIFVRPGPYIYAEWTNAGVPDRVVKLARLSDDYRTEASHWIAAVTDVLLPHLATRGGRILMLQADNEFDLFSHWFERDCGLDGDRPGFFQAFLQRRYNDDVTALNRAWGTDYAGFDAARARVQPVDALSPHDRARQADYWRFQHYATREGVRWHVDEYQRQGVDVPVLANYYPGGDVQNWRELSRVADVLGIDWYPQREFAGDGEAQRNFLDSCRYQRPLSVLPCIAEFECGVWHGYHEHVGIPTPNHYRLIFTSALLAGIAGVNWYMLVARDNWYFCPINERGEPRGELTSVFRNLHRVFRECDPSSWQKCTDTAVVFDALQIGTDQRLAQNPMLSALYNGDIDFELFDPPIGAIEKPLMFYGGAEWLPRAAQQRLVDYVEGGGTLVMAQTWPQRDEHFQPCNLLEISAPDRVLSPLGKKVAVQLGGMTPLATGSLWTWEQPPGEPILGRQSAGEQQAVENADVWMTRYIGRTWRCGYVQPRGAGRLIVLGVDPNGGIVRGVHALTGTPTYARADQPQVKTALFERAGARYVVATNLADADVGCRIDLEGVTLPARVRVTDLWSQTTEEQPADQLYVRVPRRSGGVWRLDA